MKKFKEGFTFKAKLGGMKRRVTVRGWDDVIQPGDRHFRVWVGAVYRDRKITDLTSEEVQKLILANGMGYESLSAGEKVSEHPQRIYYSLGN